MFTMPGEIKNANLVLTVGEDIRKWVIDRCKKLKVNALVSPLTFRQELEHLNKIVNTTDNLMVHKQTQLMHDEDAAILQVDSLFKAVIAGGGEGGIIRNPDAIWTPKRHDNLLKDKPFEDAEATIIGFVTGKVGKKGNLLGKIGTLVCEMPDGKVFELGTGLKTLNGERDFAEPHMTQWAEDNPGCPVPDGYKGKIFSVGEVVTYKYRELTDDGFPKEGRLWRKRDVE